MFVVFLTASCCTSFWTRRDHVLRHVSRLTIQIFRSYDEVLAGIELGFLFLADALNFLKIEAVSSSVLRCAHVPYRK
jgi:hypothetical protein